MINDNLILQVKTLSVTERIELLSLVWETLLPDDVMISREEKALLDDRLLDKTQNPKEQSRWSEAKMRLKR